jgi:rare lipoprotein A
MKLMTFRLCCAVIAAALPTAGMAGAAAAAPDTAPVRKHAKVPKKQVGKASIYARKFTNRKMANGERMDPNDDNAASKTLPLGTRARVTNLETGKSAVVTIEDRGPYVDGRIVDLSPATAGQIGLTKQQGIAQVEVTPLSVPSQRQ